MTDPTRAQKPPPDAPESWAAALWRRVSNLVSAARGRLVAAAQSVALPEAAKPLARGAKRQAVRLRRVARRFELFGFSTLTARIIVVNALALFVLVGGVLILEQYREGLIDIRVKGLTNEASLIASTVSASATGLRSEGVDPIAARAVLRRIYLPGGARVQVYDDRGRLVADTRRLGRDDQPVEISEIENASLVDGLINRVDGWLSGAVSYFSTPREIYREAGPYAISRDPTVYAAINGFVSSGESMNAQRELIITVAAPVRRVARVRGAVAVSTSGGDIDTIVTQERRAFLHVFAVAVIVVMFASYALAVGIARPIRQLSKAAEKSGAKPNAALVEIPDLTDRNDEIGHLSAALRSMTGALYARIRAIETFAADVAHEIKNPLSSLRSAVELLPAAKDAAQRDKLLAVIMHDVKRLDRLVTDVSNASRLDSELVQAERAPFDLAELLRAVASLAEMTAAEKQVTIALDTANGAAAALGLETRIAQVFHNLFDNAISFSPVGGAVSVRLTSSALGGRPSYRVEVADEGPGVPPENLESIFERFYTQRPADEAFGQHSGLGLNIARMIVEAHGGRIVARNRKDRSGAVFIVELPQ